MQAKRTLPIERMQRCMLSLEGGVYGGREVLTVLQFSSTPVVALGFTLSLVDVAVEAGSGGVVDGIKVGRTINESSSPSAWAVVAASVVAEGTTTTTSSTVTSATTTTVSETTTTSTTITTPFACMGETDEPFCDAELEPVCDAALTGQVFPPSLSISHSFARPFFKNFSFSCVRYIITHVNKGVLLGSTVLCQPYSPDLTHRSPSIRIYAISRLSSFTLFVLLTHASFNSFS